MENSFWNKLLARRSLGEGGPKPFFCLAPLADVTDPAFRRIIAKYGKPDVMWTEFVSADGLFRGGYDALIGDLDYGDAERPIIAQFFSREPEYMVKAAELSVKLGFDGVDINMGCPDDNVCKQGGGAAMIREPEQALAVIKATQEVLARSERPIPLSIKTRIGYNTNEIETWLPTLLKTKPAAITIHGRTKKEMSKVPAHWDVIARAVEIRTEIAPDVLIIGNGDVKDLDDARAKAATSKCDGIMVGRGIFGNPWLFSGKPRPTLPERLHVLAEHIQLFDELLAKRKSFAIMKKHFKSYVQGEDGDKSLVMALMATKTPAEALATLQAYKTT